MKIKYKTYICLSSIQVIQKIFETTFFIFLSKKWNVGQYLSNQNGRSPYHVIDEDSQLPMIQENVNSDAKVNRFRVSLFNKILNDINNN
jgi:hypothetical protein